MTRAAVYTRISNDPDGFQTATARQEQACRQLCEIRGWEVRQVFEDVDASAFRQVERPAFNALRGVVVCGDVDVVVCWKLDRLVRRPADFEAFWGLAEQSGVAVVSATEPIDTSNELGLALVRVLVAFASMESATTSLRLKARFAERAAQGLPPLGGRRPFGHTRDRSTIIEAEAELVREASRRIIEGDSLRSIILDWNQRGVVTTTGGPHSSQGLRGLLLSPRLVGDVEHRGKVVARDVFPAIVDRITYCRAREILLDPTRRNDAGLSRFLLSRGLLHCGKCGRHLKVGKAGARTDKRKYACSPRPDGCNGLSVLMSVADEVITDAVLEHVEAWNLASDLGRPSYAAREEIILLDAIAETSRRTQELSVDYYAHHLIARDEFLAAHQTLTQRLNRLRRRLRSPGLHLITGSNPKQLRQRWADLPVDQRRIAIAAVLHHATVLPAHAVQHPRQQPASRFRLAWHGVDQLNP